MGKVVARLHSRETEQYVQGEEEAPYGARIKQEALSVAGC